MAKRMELLVEIGSKLNAKFGAVFSSAQKQVSALDKQLKSVDFPTFGSPTIPHCKAMLSLFL